LPFAAKDIAHRVRIGKHHEIAVAGEAEGERIAMAARTAFQKGQGRL
jgi:hypothetical protein